MSLGMLLTVLCARSRLILLVVLAAAAAGLALATVMPQRYPAEASVMVRPEGLDFGSTGASTRAAVERLDNIVSTHADLIASRAVARRVVERLGLERDPEAQRLLAGAGPLHEVRGWLTDLRQAAAALFAWPQPDGTRTPDEDRIVNQLLRDLELKSARDSRVIRIRYVSAEPGFSSRVANAFAQSYLDTLVNLRVRPAQEGTRWLEERVAEMKRGLEQAESRLAAFQQRKGIVASDERLDVETARLNEISAQLAAAQSQSYASQARQQQLREFLRRGGSESPSEVLANPVVQQLKQSVADREAKIAEMSRRYGPNHPQYRAARTELQDLRRQLNEQMQSTARSLLAGGGVSTQQEGSLRSELERQRNRVLAMKSDRNQLAILTRDADNARRAYDAAAQRLSQLRLESEVDQASGSIVAAAVAPTNPMGPGAALYVLVALVGGVLAGVGLALALEAATRYVRSEQDLYEIMGVPVLAVLNPGGGTHRRARHLESPNVYSLPKA